jgi:hypothetical protein
MAEEEYQYVLHTLSCHGTHDQLVNVFRRMGEYLGELGATTEEILREYFSSPAAVLALHEMPEKATEWRMSTITVDPNVRLTVHSPCCLRPEFALCLPLVMHERGRCDVAENGLRTFANIALHAHARIYLLRFVSADALSLTWIQ